MKKIALTSLLAVFAAAGAQATNVIDGNPLYMPKAGHFYSETGVRINTEMVDWVNLSEKFGYGITDRLTATVSTNLYEANWFDEYTWNNVKLDLAFRALDSKNWKLDVTGGYSAGGTGIALFWGDDGALMYHMNDKTKWFDKEATVYSWNAGVRGGYTTGDMTIAGHLDMYYLSDESFAWNDADNRFVHLFNFGLNTQFALNDKVSAVLGAEYWNSYEEYHEKRGFWELTFGANYNIDATKYIGAYVTKMVQHDRTTTSGRWEFEDGFGLGVKFGVDF